MKAKEVHKFNDEELKVEHDRLRRQLFELRSQAVTEKLENPRQLGVIRRDIARLLTEQNARSARSAAKTESKPAATSSKPAAPKTRKTTKTASKKA